jgi:transcriptional regulator with XRE-family HTH domain
MPGKIIKKIRLELNYSQAAVAKHLGIKQSTYSKLESNEIKLTIPQCKKLSEFFGLNVYERFGDEFVVEKAS